MNWTDVTAPASEKVLRQFGLLSLAVFTGWGAWRALQGQPGAITIALIAAGVTLGALALTRPMTLGPVFTAAMVLAFPIGWALSRAILAVLFYLVFTPVALVFRLIGRDALRLKRPPASTGSYWTKVAERSADSYFRQS